MQKRCSCKKTIVLHDQIAINHPILASLLFGAPSLVPLTNLMIAICFGHFATEHMIGVNCVR